MAVDTRNKRFSLISVARAVGRVLPNPDGGFTTQGDRQQLALLYAGVLAAAVSYSCISARPVVNLGDTTPGSWNDALDWQQTYVTAGGTYNLNSPIAATSTEGKTITASCIKDGGFPTIGLTLYQEMPVVAASTWTGNFLTADWVIDTWGGGADPMTLTFTQALYGIAFQVQSGSVLAYDCVVKAYDASDVLVKTCTRTDGVLDPGNVGNNAAIVMGILSSLPTIKKITISVRDHADGLTPTDAAINQLSLAVQLSGGGGGATDYMATTKIRLTGAGN